MKKLIFATLIVISVFFAFLGYMKFGKKEEGIKVLKTEKVIRGKIEDVIEATAIVKTQVNAYVKVGARATGKIQKMNVDIGDHVKKGELIAIIDQREILKDIEKSEADLKKAKANLSEIRETYPLKIKEAEKRVNSAKAKYRYALWKYKREEELLKKEFTTEENFEIAKRELDKAKAELELAEATLERIKKEFVTKLERAEKEVEYAEKVLEKNKIRLTYTQIYSPIDGIVSKIAAREGETVVAGLQVANLITILDPSKLEVRIYTDETDIGKVKVGQKVFYYADAYPDKVFEGVISKIYPEPVVRENIVYYMTIVNVKKKYAKYLKPEMTVYAKIITGVKEDAILVPNRALKFEKGRQYVFKIVNGKPVKTYVKTGWISERYTEVIEGLKEGDTVATEVIIPIKTKKLPEKR
ncbi:MULTISPECIES: efflux RND transporter periplasmic adaptor subunit [Persephonella]|nr:MULTISPECIES: efflux RND transporter periplasmic adaptor subunit [Persephonella]